MAKKTESPEQSGKRNGDGMPGGDGKPAGEKAGPEAAAPESAAPGAGAQLNVLGQYIKDLSFESPHAPQTLQNPPPNPQLQVTVNVNVASQSPETYEVVLNIDVHAKHHLHESPRVMSSGVIASGRSPSTTIRTTIGSDAGLGADAPRSVTSSSASVRRRKIMLRRQSSQGRLISALSGEATDPPPIWLMRQAGRYLPEYREARVKAGSFLDLCLNPSLAAEVTLQPLRRFDLDAAIVFSDILMVPYALGQKVEFVEGEGPKLEPVRCGKELARLDGLKANARFAPVYETLARVVPELPAGVPVIGFCGAPWTVATYMVEGAGSKDQAQARLWAYRDPASFQSLIDLLVETSIDYLLGQVKGGARVLQIFDSWAGGLPEDEFARWCVLPTRAIVAGVKASAPAVPVIGFPRGCGPLAEAYAHGAQEGSRGGRSQAADRPHPCAPELSEELSRGSCLIPPPRGEVRRHRRCRWGGG